MDDALLNNGFTPDEPESIMIGEARVLAVDVSLPVGVRLRRVTSEYSRPILERSGLVPVSTTTPYRWQRWLAPTSPRRLRRKRDGLDDATPASGRCWI
jgi:hypothetical protein